MKNRKSIRLRDYDYGNAGAYFVTVCVQHKDCLFGDMREGEMVLNSAGKMVKSVWKELPKKFPSILIDEFIVMPNHFHGIINIVGALLGAPQNECASHTEGAASSAPTTLGDPRSRKSFYYVKCQKLSINRRFFVCWPDLRNVLKFHNELYGLH